MAKTYLKSGIFKDFAGLAVLVVAGVGVEDGVGASAILSL
jgi:hypothetical protein